MKKFDKSLIAVHIAVLLFGVAGIFGKLISLSAIHITFGRVLFAAIGLGLLHVIQRKGFSIASKRLFLQLFIAGIILAFHWWAFFHAIQLSNVAIGLLTFSTFPVFTLFLEPIFYKEKFYLKNALVASLTFGGVYFIVPGFDFENQYFLGAFWGVLSGLSFAMLHLMNRNILRFESSIKITFYEVLIASVVLIPVSIGTLLTVSLSDLLLLIVLGIVFTAFAHTLFIHSFNTISVFTASIVSTLEPVYGILFAMLIISEFPETKTLIGGTLIVVANVAMVFIRKVKK